MRIRFDTIDEPVLDYKWKAIFNEHWPAYQRWFLSEGYKDRPIYKECRQQFSHYMPELLSCYDHICQLSGGSDLASRFLSLYCPPAYITGCSQIVWPGQSPSLIRNYDYHPRLLDAVILKSKWHDKSVVAMTDCLWGATDGMNEDGLAISLTFGGSQKVGIGFGIPIIIRYILEFCTTVKEAGEVLSRIPTHMCYNITMLDKSGAFLTAFIGPDQTPAIRPVPIATNHQGGATWENYARKTMTIEREQFLNYCLADGRMNERGMLNAFLNPPLYTNHYSNGFGTVFTSQYKPEMQQVLYHWPHFTWDCSFNYFHEASRIIHYTPNGALIEPTYFPKFK
ncbi:MAG: C45 family autoproteolytic acyltransferase/hydrolase [Ostreibacterium sp.]